MTNKLLVSRRLCLHLHLHLLLLFLSYARALHSSASLAQGSLPRGFHVSLHVATGADFTPVLQSARGIYAAGFSRTAAGKYLLSVVCQPKPGTPPATVWAANRHHPVTAMAGTELTQSPGTGSLELRDGATGSTPVWATGPAGHAAALSLSDAGNLRLADGATTFWQSFEHPTDTVLQGQNFTANVSLSTDDGGYAFRLGPTSMGLWWGRQQYWRHTAMQEKALIVPGAGPIYMRLAPGGYVAMYQREGPPVDLFPLATYHDSRVTLRRLRLEPDGNLVAYYWDAAAASWRTDFRAVDSDCDLPAACGSHAVCTVSPDGGGPVRCTCLYGGRPPDCPAPASAAAGNFCSGDVAAAPPFDRFPGADLPYREFAAPAAAASESQCEATCRRDCDCVAAVYGNRTATCYPITGRLMTVAHVDDPSKVLLVRRTDAAVTGAAVRGTRRRLCGGAVAAIVSLAVAGFSLATVFAVTCWRRWRRRRRREQSPGEDEMAVQMAQKLTPYSRAHHKIMDDD